MNHLECFEKMLKGNLAFFELLINMVNNKPDSNFLADRDNIKAAKVGANNLLLLSIKEDLVQINGDDLEYCALDLDLKQAMDFILDKDSDGKCIKNQVCGVTFKNPSEIINLFRRKQAHDYAVDFKGNKIVLYHDKKEMKININVLTSFVSALSDAYFKEVNKSKVEKKVYFFNCLPHERLKSEADILALLNSNELLEITLTRKSGKKIDDRIYEIVDNYIKTYSIIGNRQIIADCSKNFGEDYLFETNFKSYFENREKAKVFAKDVAKIIKDNPGLSNEQKINIIKYQLDHTLNVDNMKYNAAYNARMLLDLLKAIQATGSVNRDLLSVWLSENCHHNLILDQNLIITASIMLFQSTISYIKDNVVRGLDYSILDLSDITPEIYSTKDGYIEDLKARINACYKELCKLYNDKDLLDDQKRNLEKMNNENALTKVNKSIEVMYSNINNVKDKIRNFELELKEKENLKTPEYCYNRGIIWGIRNAIAHGYYPIKPAKTLNKTKITFEDKGGLKNKTNNNTFKCEVTFQEFSNLLRKNITLLIEYINENKEKKEQTLLLEPKDN